MGNAIVMKSWLQCVDVNFMTIGTELITSPGAWKDSECGDEWLIKNVLATKVCEK